jgi:oxygen-independent coproporphyrinogen-3 oxidase
MKSPAEARRAVPTVDLVTEFAINAFRLAGGFTRPVFTERTGLPWAVLAGPLATAEARGWLVQTADGVRPTATGFRFLNDVQLLFLADEA